jgi:hypothetical protein
LGIRNHERGGRTKEKHGETEATEKSSKNSKPIPGFLGGEEKAKNAFTR